MGYILLWIESLASAVLLVAVAVALSSRLSTRWRQILWPVLTAMAPCAVFTGASVSTGYHQARNFNPKWLFGYALSLAVCFLVGSVLTIWFGLRRRKDKSSVAASWPRSKLACALSIIVLFNGTTFFLMDLSARLELARLEAGARAKAVSLAPPYVPDERNAQLVYEQAFEALGGAEMQMEAEWLFETYLPEFNPTRKEVAPFLESKKEAIELLHKAASMPDYYFGTNYSDIFGMDIPSLASCRNAANLLCLNARYKAVNGDMRGAMKDLFAVRAIAEHTSRTPLLIVCMITVATDAIASEAFEMVLADGPIRRKDLDGLARPPFLSCLECLGRSMEMEEAFGIGAYSVLAMEGERFAWGEHTEGWNPEKLILPFSRIFLVSGDIDGYRKGIRECQRLFGKPFFEAREGHKKLEEEAESWGKGSHSEGIIESFSRSRSAVDQGDAMHLLADLGLAVACYHGEKRGYPATLSDLVPEFMSQIPIDPYDGKPLKMVLADGGMILYSVGEDQEDNGGVGRDPQRDKEDIIFCLGPAFTERRVKPALEYKARREARKKNPVRRKGIRRSPRM